MADYDEPWELGEDDLGIDIWIDIWAATGVVASASQLTGRQARLIQRAIACVNALAGIDDPAAYLEQQQFRIAELERQLAIARKACQYALDYDKLICGQANQDDISIDDNGDAWTSGDDLDAAYLNWQQAAQQALADTCVGEFGMAE